MREPHEPPRWSLATRVAFRFMFCYFTLYSFLPTLTSRIDFLRGLYGTFWESVVVQANEAVVHLPDELVFDPIGLAYGWIQILCSLALAGAATIVWSVLDHRRAHARLYPWFRLAMRYLLAGSMIRYGTLWSVEEISRDGGDVPLHTDPDRWRLVMFLAPGSLRVETMAGSWKTHDLDLDMERKRMTLGPQGAFSFQQPEKDVLVLDGQLEGRRLRAKLRKVPLLRRTT